MPPRWQLSRPSAAVLASLREELVEAPFSYTKAELATWPTVRDEEAIGPAAALPVAAKRLLSFEHLCVPSMEVSATTAQPGGVVAFGVASGPLWGLCACRVIDIASEPDRLALTYGTLPVHAVVGQETFELRVEGGRLLFAIEKRFELAGAARWFSPLTHHLQKRFVAEVTNGMRDSCQ